MKIKSIHYLLLAITAFLLSACENNNDILYDYTDASSITGETNTGILLDTIKSRLVSDSLVFPDGYYTIVRVISDNSAGNIEKNSFVVNSVGTSIGSSAILRSDSFRLLAAGAVLKVEMAGAVLKKINGEFILLVPAAQISVYEYAAETPTDLTIKTLLKLKDEYEGHLVRLAAGSFSGGDGKFTRTISYTDATGTISSTVLPTATFYGQSYPANIVYLTGIARVTADGSVRVDIRNTSDLVTAAPYTLSENFSSADISYYYKNSKRYSSTLETDLMYWTLADGISKTKYVKSGDADAALLTLGQIYLTVLPVIQRNTSVSGLYNSLLPYSSDKSFTKADSVTITVAGSLMGASDYPSDNSMVFDTFNPSRHTYKVQVLTAAGTVQSESPLYNDRGIVHTVTLPTGEAFGSIRIAQQATCGTTAMENSDGSYTSSRLYQHGIPVIIEKISFKWNAYY